MTSPPSTRRIEGRLLGPLDRAESPENRDEGASSLLSLWVGTAAEYSAQRARLDPYTLLVVHHGSDGANRVGAAQLEPGPVTIYPPNALLEGSPSIEVWLSSGPVRTERHGDFECSSDGRLLFGSLRQRPGPRLEQSTEEAFRDLLTLIEAQGFPNLLRLWNLIPDINGPGPSSQGGLERYRSFNLGRARAFEARYGVGPAEARYPASTAVGTVGEDLLVWFAAARGAGRHLENRRQQSAYRYPAIYGPKPPSFSRATLLPPEIAELTFVSGTASIVGSESLHHGCIRCQLEETWTNLEPVIEEASRPLGRAIDPRQDLRLVKTYVRDATKLPEVRAGLANHLDPAVPVI